LELLKATGKHGLKQASVTRKLHDYLRVDVPTVDEDRYFEPDMELLFHKIRHGEIITFIEELVGKLPF